MAHSTHDPLLVAARVITIVLLAAAVVVTLLLAACHGAAMRADLEGTV